MYEPRKIKFRLSDKAGFDPDTSQKEAEQMKPGYFHAWTQVARISPKTSTPYIDTQAIVEDAETHKLKIIPLEWLEFVD